MLSMRVRLSLRVSWALRIACMGEILAALRSGIAAVSMTQSTPAAAVAAAKKGFRRKV